jgi:hypothetical protein
VEEIENQFPIGNEIDATNRNQIDYVVYLPKLAILFPVGRQFASFKQLTQVCEMFLDAFVVITASPPRRNLINTLFLRSSKLWPLP